MRNVVIVLDIDEARSGRPIACVVMRLEMV